MAEPAKYAVRNYQTGEIIGHSTLTDEQFAHYESMSDRDTGAIRLGALPHDFYELNQDAQDTHEDTAVFLD